MILLQIFDIKDTMTGLLLKEDYDFFYLEEAKVTTFAKLQISGFRNLKWYDNEEREDLSEYILWREARPFLFSYIKGKKTPASFQISLRAPRGYLQEVLGADAEENIDFFLHFRFEAETLSLVTGCFYHEFTLDKKAEYAWDTAVKNFLREKKIAYEEK